VRLLAGILRSRANLVPRLREVVRLVKIGEPAITHRASAPEYAVDVTTDQQRHAWFLDRLRIHHGAGNVVSRVLAVDFFFGPQPVENLQVLVHQLAALFERNADRIELALVPA